MKKVLLLAAILLGLSAQSQSFGTLEGEALDALNLTPLDHWTIELLQGEVRFSTEVKENGTFRIEQVPTGFTGSCIDASSKSLSEASTRACSENCGMIMSL